jgi:GNAT superfamily N-acetyltransferase
VVEAELKVDDPFEDDRRYFVLDGPAVLGQLWVGWETPQSPGYASNARFLWTDAGVVGPARRQGIGTAFARQLLALMSEQERAVATTWTEEDDGRAFLSWLGAELVSTGAENRLHLPDVDWDMVRRWVTEGAARNPDTELVFYEHRVPEAARADYSAAISTMLNTMPFDNMAHGDIVVTPETMAVNYEWMATRQTSHHSYLTREADGTISGITDIGASPIEPDRVHQRFTGVRPDFRGRGLGKWLKAAMLEYIRTTYPDARWMTTGNANSNDPMLGINRKLGFKTHRGSTTYQLTREGLADRLAEIQPG